MILEQRIEAKKKHRKLIDAEIKFLQAQLEHRKSKQKPEKPASEPKQS
jgi:hypothetical protein